MARLFHRELVTIYPLDRSAQRVDELGGEPYARLARGTTVELLGQVEEDRRGGRRPGQGGAEVQDGGTVSFRLRDVTASGWTPVAGDEIRQVAERDGANPRAVRWYVLEAHRSGKRPRGKRADLVVVRFGTRPPSRAQVEGL